MRVLQSTIASVLVLGALAACTAADRENMFSSERAPLVGRCDAQPGYPDPSVRKGCENRIETGRSR